MQCTPFGHLCKPWCGRWRHHKVWNGDNLPFRNTRHQKTSMLCFSRSVVGNSLWPRGLQHARLLCLSPSPRVCSDSCPLSRWCHPTISSAVAPFSCPHFFPASGSFPVSPVSPALRIRCNVYVCNTLSGKKPAHWKFHWSFDIPCTTISRWCSPLLTSGHLN